jgi:glycosyltransferase involved in cell wall biosynthesis
MIRGNPKVSICIPAYQQPEFLRRSLNSVVKQTFGDYEVVITDDSRCDEVKKVAEEFIGQIRDLKYFKNTLRKGPPENWNESMRRASGEYIKILHHDDWLADEASLEKYAKMLEDNSKADFAFSATSNMTAAGERFSIHSLSEEQLNLLRHRPEYLFQGNLIGAPSAVIFRASLGLEFDPKLKWLVDIEFYMRLLAQNPNFIYCPEELVCVSENPYRVTLESQNNVQVEIPETLYLYYKMPFFKRMNPRLFFLVFWSLIRRFKIKRTSDLKKCKLMSLVPLPFYLLVWFQDVLVYLHGINNKKRL